jgi:hypothetical protein
MGISSSRNQVVDGSTNLSPAETPSSLTVEIKTYVNDQISNMKVEIQNDSRLSKNTPRGWWPENGELQEQKKKYDELMAKYSELVEKHNNLVESGVEVKEYSSKVSEKVVDDYVRDMLDHPDVQHGYFTEAIEGIVYRRALKSVLHAIARATETAQIQLMGHRFIFGIEPIPEEKPIAVVEEKGKEDV